jgi:hypothetical protein
MRFTLACEPRSDCATAGWVEATSDETASERAARRDVYFTGTDSDDG